MEQSVSAWTLNTMARQSFRSLMPVAAEIIAARIMERLGIGAPSPSDVRVVSVEEAKAADFVPPSDWTTIRAAIAWNSDQMLTIHAARAFLACSAAHSGNVLIDATGKLYSVDHELCCRTNMNEFDVLAEHTKKNTRAWRALQQVARLSYFNLLTCFDDLPQEVTWPLSRDKTIAYFCRRLHRWKELFT